MKDEFGLSLGDRSEIPYQAVITAHSLLTDGEAEHGSRTVFVSVRDEQGAIIYTVHANSIGNWVDD